MYIYFEEITIKIVKSPKFLLLMILMSIFSVAQAQHEVEHLYFTTGDGLKLHYAKLGNSGSPVILIHSSGGMART